MLTEHAGHCVASVQTHVSECTQAWYAVHPPKRGSRCKGTRPYVHRGFLRTWRANGLDGDLVGRLTRTIEQMQGKSGRVKLYVTGARIGWQTLPSVVPSEKPGICVRCCRSSKVCCFQLV